MIEKIIGHYNNTSEWARIRALSILPWRDFVFYGKHVSGEDKVPAKVSRGPIIWYRKSDTLPADVLGLKIVIRRLLYRRNKTKRKRKKKRLTIYVPAGSIVVKRRDKRCETSFCNLCTTSVSKSVANLSIKNKNVRFSLFN